MTNSKYTCHLCVSDTIEETVSYNTITGKCDIVILKCTKCGWTCGKAVYEAKYGKR